MSARAPAAQANSLADENLAVFGAQAYRDLKRHVVEVNHARAARRAYAQTGTWSNKPVEAQSIMRVAGRVAQLVDDHGIDLQEVFLDTPRHVGVVRNDVRISFAELRRGLWRLLSCMPLA